MSKLSEKVKKKTVNAPLQPWQMSASDVDAIARHYKKKRGINIIKNGETALGREQIQIKEAALKKEYTDSLAKLKDEGTKYTQFIDSVGFIYDTYSLHQFIIGDGNNQFLRELCKNYLDSSNCYLKQGMTEEERKTLNEMIQKNPRAKALLDPLIENYYTHKKKSAKERIADVCLSEKEAWEEIKRIQAGLKENEYVGYMFTNGSKKNKKHFEVVIIGSEGVIKPVSWFGVHNPLHTSDEVATVGLNSPTILKSQGSIPEPQADMVTCGTLSLMYTKELLKDNARQLKERTLRIPFYDEKGALKWFFYPSPQTLRYSQSSTYNELLCLMLTDEETPQNYSHKENNYEIATLKGLLIRCIETARQKNEGWLVDYNLKLLANLDNFRTHWLADYNKAMQKRMDFADSEGNQYLAYSSRRMYSHTLPVEALEELPIEELLQVLENYTPKEILDLPLPSPVHKQVFDNEDFWLRKFQKHFPHIPTDKSQSAFEFFWATYAKEYEPLSEYIANLFSAAKESKLRITDFGEWILSAKDKSGHNLLYWIMQQGNQDLITAIYQKFIKGKDQQIEYLFNAVFDLVASGQKSPMTELVLSMLEHDTPAAYRSNIQSTFEAALVNKNHLLINRLLEREFNKERFNRVLSPDDLAKAWRLMVSSTNFETAKQIENVLPSGELKQFFEEEFLAAATNGELKVIHYLTSPVTCSILPADKTIEESLKKVAANAWAKQLDIFRLMSKTGRLEKLDPNLLTECLALANKNKAPLEFRNWLTNAKAPASYASLTNPQQEKLAKIRALLDDYTKGDSATARFFHFHWNRHHTKRLAEIVKAIDAGNVTLQEVVEQLKEIEPENKTGSFARRRQYILDKLNVEESDTPEQHQELRG
ncbi:DUF5617 domain-containing protein [Legionella jamestowniensis]|uniref:F-box domain-containing protein n=1 Tax=Legionella jamestowniensis TaxID=455 RepID=A0A0W0UIT6_9GAMM|nr:DUF5617 domain-containing protein [Legionella jamestowniensis]KTD07784.1 hypothetical protein Ljam_1979 [Legionella jamestowniensis]SFL62141.1 hypothetical protein SAMN02746073_1103 [Legionella jamestowniensis DSM 19215]